MPNYQPEPPYEHGSLSKPGILLINLGTPDAPTPHALRPYLKEFLGDPRIVEMPRALWWLILNGIILNTRPKKSAEKYAIIWTDEGSPLLAHTRRQAKLLTGYLGESVKAPFAVDYAMRYGNPSIASALARLKQQGCDRILIFPLYPQYSATSTGSAFDGVCSALTTMRNVPAIRTIKHYHDHPGYVAAIAQSIREHWMQHGRPDKLVMSFHGVPRAMLDRGDPYHCECQNTARLIAEALGLEQRQYQACFQSLFGRGEWLKPYTADTLAALGRTGTGRVDVICPGFAGDCLETLEEIAVEGKATFLSAGGKEFHYIPCLNERPEWITAMRDIVLENLQGWLTTDQAAQKEAASERRDRAIAMGAKT